VERLVHDHDPGLSTPLRGVQARELDRRLVGLATRVAEERAVSMPLIAASLSASFFCSAMR